MAFCFVVGTNDFTSPLKAYENVAARCNNCGNFSARPISSWEWFTFCWIPVIPLGSKHKDLACSVCRFRQDLRQRSDVTAGGGGGPMPPQHHHQGPPQGWNNQPPQQGWGGPGQGPPPGQHGGPPQQYK